MSALSDRRHSGLSAVSNCFHAAFTPTTAHGLAADRASCGRVSLTKYILGAGDENAGAACLAPDALINCSRRTVIVVPWEKLALVDPQLTVKQMQLFYTRMSMRGVTRAGRKTYQHAEAPAGRRMPAGSARSGPAKADVVKSALLFVPAGAILDG